MTNKTLLAVAGMIAASLSAVSASATTYIFSVAENGGPTYGFSLDSTLGVSPGTKGLVTNFTNVAYTTNGVASGTTSVNFSGRNIGTDPFNIVVSGDLDLSRFAIGSGPTVSFPVGTFSAIDFATVVPVGGVSTDNVILTVTTEDLAPAVPEPATWAMMAGGFGLVGGAMRRRRAKPGITFA